MELYTMNRQFLRQDVIDGFNSVIWTERYYGDGEFELHVPASQDMVRKLPEGKLLGLVGTSEPMMIETVEIEEGQLKVSGLSLLAWMNNRFVRVSGNHADTTWVLDGAPGYLVWKILWNMCSPHSPYLDGTLSMGIANPGQFIIPNLKEKTIDFSGTAHVTVQYAPVYDEMKKIATTYDVGMQITVENITNTGYDLYFRSYKGLDRTSRQTVNPIVRFSPIMDSLAGIKELRSIANQKTNVWSFAPDLVATDATPPDPDLTTGGAGSAGLSGSQLTGFDLRAEQIFLGGVGRDDVGNDPAQLHSVLNGLAQQELWANAYIRTVDGEIVPTNQYRYGRDFNLGDQIEVQGNSGVTEISRVTEYIRAQDASGEKAYPTVAALG
jgi:Siphovirus ReqiPepy6 Gp37-like protein